MSKPDETEVPEGYVLEEADIDGAERFYVETTPDHHPMTRADAAAWARGHAARVGRAEYERALRDVADVLGARPGASLDLDVVRTEIRRKDSLLARQRATFERRTAQARAEGVREGLNKAWHIVDKHQDEQRDEKPDDRLFALGTLDAVKDLLVSAIERGDHESEE